MHNVYMDSENLLLNEGASVLCKRLKVFNKCRVHENITLTFLHP